MRFKAQIFKVKFSLFQWVRINQTHEINLIKLNLINITLFPERIHPGKDRLQFLNLYQLNELWLPDYPL